MFTELAKATDAQTTVHLWRSTSGAEVDFVLVRGDELLAVEVQASPVRRPKLRRSTRSFIDAYRPAEVLIVNTALSHGARLDETRLRWLTPLELVERLTPG